MKMLRFFFFTLVGLMALEGLANGENDPKKQPRQGVRRIVIDAGHGGSDPGARGRYSTEKDICLAISLRLEQMLKQEMPDVDIYMTRKTDVFDPVTVKARMANEAKGDLFVSIHVNSAEGIRHRELSHYETRTVKNSKGKKITKKVPVYRTWTSPNPAKGTETFIWGNNKNEEKLGAMQENENLYLDSVSARELADFDPYDPVKFQLYSLKSKQYFERSALLAVTVEEEFQKFGRISRKAQQRQKGIWVLHAVAMPAVLIETGFISNPEEEDYLNSEQGQIEICTAIVRALKRYKFSLENKSSNTQSSISPSRGGQR
ncbi:MAG: N-acetylmuramoyl-L-alanine amidase [Hydrotalea sp.]|nr:N-acetylmuramoyl-L-alanine amidase [Hydrotalea sp.]